MLENYSLDNWKKGIHGIGIEISSDCNLRCKYCYYYRLKRLEDPTCAVTDELFYGNIEKILDKIFEEYPNVRSIDFWGAEPLLHIERIKKVVEYIIENYKGNTFDFLISSNMYHEKELYDNLFSIFDEFESLLENKDLKFSFNVQTSIDFPKEIHNKYRVKPNNRGTFSKVKYNYISFMKRVAKKKYKKLFFNIFTKSTYNYKELDINTIRETPDYIDSEVLENFPIIAKCKEISNNFNFNIDYFATPATGIEYTLDDGLKNYVYYQRIIENFERLYNSGTLTYANSMFFIPGHLRVFISDLLNLRSLENSKEDYPVCRSGVLFIGIRNNGDIFPCHHFFSMANRDKYRIGNIFTGEYNEELILTILNTYFILSETFKDFEDKVFMPKYSKNLNYGSLSIISGVFYKFLLRHFCFAENCEFRDNWSNEDLNSLLKIYPVQWLELILGFISKYRKVFNAVADATFNVAYKDLR